MHRWAKCGVFEEAYKKVLKLYKRVQPPTRYLIDSTFVKNAFGRTCVGRNPTDRGRKACKLSVITDQNGVVNGMAFSPANRHDATLMETTLKGMLTDLEGLPLYADRGYDSRNNRKICTSFGLQDRIFRRRTRTTRRANAKRVVVENTFSWIDKYRRLLYFYEHDEHQHRAFLMIALGNKVVKRFLESASVLHSTFHPATKKME
jgi:IS5 family transposase